MAGNLFILNFNLKKLIKKFLLLLFLLFFFDRAIGIVVQKQFLKVNRGNYGKINESLNTKAEIIIFGSSRAENHYNSEIISKQTNMTCMNTGIGGQSIYFNYALLASILQNNHPKLIILDIAPNVITDSLSYQKLDFFNPYYGRNNYFNEILELSPNYSEYKFLSYTYRYNSTIYYIFMSDIFGSDKMKNGFQPLNGQLDSSTFTPFNLNYNEKFDIMKKKYLNKFIALALKNKIKIICAISPTYKKFDTNNRIINQVKDILSKYKLKLYDYSDSPLFYNHPQFFYNQLHLNKKGSDKFTFEISRLINNVQ